MTNEQKINHMIQTLQIALDELKYKDKYTEKETALPKGVDRNTWYVRDQFYRNNRSPNLTLVRENLKSVGRFAYIVEKEIPMR